MKKYFIFGCLLFSLISCRKTKLERNLPIGNAKELMSVVVDTSRYVSYYADSINHSPLTSIEVCPKPIENWYNVNGNIYKIDIKLSDYDTVYGRTYNVNYKGTNCTGGINKCIIIYRGDTVYNNL